MIDREIRKKVVKRSALIDCVIPAGISYDKDRGQFSPDDRMSAVMAEVADLDTEIKKLQYEKLVLIREISEAIESLENDEEKVVLLSYYIGRLPMRRIAEEAHYSIRTAYYLRRKGIQHLSLHTLQNQS